MTELVDISLTTAGTTAVLGYLVVFLALVLLMAVIMVMGALMRRRAPAAQTADAAPAEAEPPAPGTAGEVKLYDTDPRTAAMLMAITADELGAPLNELRFLSIREVKEQDEHEV